MQLDFADRIIQSGLFHQNDMCPEKAADGSDSQVCSKTLQILENHELCNKIRQIKHVKTGSKRELKFVQENTSAIMKNMRQCKKADSKKSFQNVGVTQENKTKKISKKISKQYLRRLKNRKSLKDDLTETDKFSYFKQQGQSSNYKSTLAQQTILGYKGMKIYENIIQGEIGHSTLVFSHHITEGSYYLQYKVMNSFIYSQKDDYRNQPQIRIGVCGPDHKFDIPLGYKKSIGFLLSKKQIITQGKPQKLSLINQQLASEKIKDGDIIGFQLSFSPPYKNPDYSKNWQDSSLTIFLNGQFLGKYQGLRQMFYYPAISLYNGAAVQIHTKECEMLYMPSSSLPYEKITQFINIYA